MPYERKRFPVSTDRVSAYEIADLWKQATKVPPYPDDDWNLQLAEVMNAHRANGAVKELTPSLLDAVDVLLNHCRVSRLPDGGDENTVFRDSTYGPLEKSLLSIRPIIASEQESLRNGKNWYYVPTTVFWSCACGALEQLGRTAGGTRDSVAVKFAVMAARRMGWMQATTAGLEAFLQRKAAPTKTD